VAAHESRAPLSPTLRNQRTYLAGGIKSFPVQRDEHLMTVLRYVLQNPVRAGLSSTAREWSWSSRRRPQWTDRCPVDEDRQWLEQLDEPARADQLAVLRECLNRQRPFGKTDWQG
jgi:putative transposase